VRSAVCVCDMDSDRFCVSVDREGEKGIGRDFVRVVFGLGQLFEETTTDFESFPIVLEN
jgi:hypothetical protein